MQTYSVLGNPIHHSLSPTIHKLFAQQTNQQITYTATLVPLNQFSQAVQHAQDNNYHGLNITSPFKQQAFAICHNTSPASKAAKSVNTIIFKEDGRVFGENTDGLGLIRDLKLNQKFDLSGKAVLILGAGGAARGVASKLSEEGVKCLHIHSSNSINVRSLVRDLKLGNNILLQEGYDLILNTTPDDNNSLISELSSIFVTSTTLCYDLNYTNPDSAFLLWSKKHKAGYIQNGLGMLVEQAAESFYIWRKVRPETAPILRKLYQLR